MAIELKRARISRIHETITESQLQTEIRKVIGALPDVRLWRNNVGQLKDRHGQTIRYGLCVGSADLIGVVAPHGRLLAIEVKTTRGVVRQEQTDWLEIVRRFGGVAGVARSVETAMRLVESARRPASEDPFAGGAP